MRNIVAIGFVVLGLVAGSALSAEVFTGHYVGVDDAQVVLDLQEAVDGSVSGTLTAGASAAQIAAQRNGSALEGSISMGVVTLNLSGRWQGDRMTLAMGDGVEITELAFRPAASGAGNAADPAARSAAPPAAVASGGRKVIINSRTLSDAELQQVEQRYRIRIADAEYWYDAVLGAWGAKGGPAMGFLPAGLQLGGALRADASGGGTGIFVNGRELHPYDVSALARVTGPIQPGRYFITAQGLAGYEGGPALWNLLALASSNSNGSGTWQSRLSSGIDGGDTGAVFLPNGGIVSY